MNIQTIKIPLQSASVKPYIKQGDTIKAIRLSAPDWGFDLTAATTFIYMDLLKGNQVVARYTKGNGITANTALEFQINEVKANNFPYGELKGDLQISWIPSGGTEDDRQNFTFFNIIYTITEEFTKVG